MIHPLADCKSANIGENTNVWQFCVVLPGASIGANSTIVCGHTIGENAMIGAGSVVTHDIPAGELWYGNPARYIRNVET